MLAPELLELESFGLDWVEVLVDISVLIIGYLVVQHKDFGLLAANDRPILCVFLWHSSPREPMVSLFPMLTLWRELRSSVSVRFGSKVLRFVASLVSFCLPTGPKIDTKKDVPGGSWYNQSIKRTHNNRRSPSFIK